MRRRYSRGRQKKRSFNSRAKTGRGRRRVSRKVRYSRGGIRM